MKAVIHAAMLGEKKSILTESVSILHVYQLYNYFRNENNTEM